MGGAGAGTGTERSSLSATHGGQEKEPICFLK